MILIIKLLDPEETVSIVQRDMVFISLIFSREEKQISIALPQEWSDEEGDAIERRYPRALPVGIYAVGRAFESRQGRH